LLPDPIGHSRNAGGEMVDLRQASSVSDEYQGSQGFKHLRFTGTKDGNCVACADLCAVFGCQPRNAACYR
jgi:hypothetical protein